MATAAAPTLARRAVRENYLLGVDESDLEAGQQERDGDARAHRAGTDHPNRLHPRGRAWGAGDSEGRAFGEEEVTPRSGLLRLNQLWRFVGSWFGDGGGRER